MGKIIAIVNQKGGVGKTTTSVNLADNLSLSGKNVLLIDLDSQGSATTSLGINRGVLNCSVYDLFLGKKTVEDVIVKPRYSNIDLIPATIDFSNIEYQLIENEYRDYILYEILKTQVENYDFIIMDCPPALGFVTINALQAANTVLIPVQCHFLALDGLTQLLNTIRIVQKSKKMNNRELSLEGVLVTMLDKRTKISWEVIREIKEYFGEKVFKTFITMNVSCQVAPSHGMPLSKYDKKSVATKLYKELAKEVIKNNAR